MIRKFCAFFLIAQFKKMCYNISTERGDTMGKTSAAVKNRYIAKKYDRVNIPFHKGDKDRYKAHAAARGKSLTALIVELLERDIEDLKRGE